MAGSLFSMGNLARVAKVVALLLFLAPWVTVSCSPQALGPAAGAPRGMMEGSGDVVLVKATGAQLAMGTATPNNPNPGASPPPNPFGQANYPIALGALLILLSLAATFVLKGSKAALAAAAASALAAAALCYAVLVAIPKLVHASFASGAGAGGSSPIDPAELARMIHVEVEIGFWLTLLALILAIVLDVLAMKRAAPVAYAAAAPPAEPPPPEAPPEG